MDNPFDQFDATQAAASANPFDQFDAKDAVPNPFEDKPEPGVLSRVGSAIAGGAKSGFQDLLTNTIQNTNAISGKDAAAAPQDTDPRAQSIDWFHLPTVEGLEKGIYQTTKGLVSSAPEMAGAIAGGALGTAAVGGPADPLAALAAPVGAALGAGGVSALRNLVPLYTEEKAKGLSDDEAYDAAKSRALREGLITGATFGLFELRPVIGGVKSLLSDAYARATTAAAKKAVMDQGVQSTAVGPGRNLVEQALVVQPGAAAAGQVANNAVEGKPLGENVANAAGSAAIGTVVPMGAHLAGSAAIGKAKDAPAAEAPTQPGPGRGAADQAVGVAGAPSEKIAGVLNSNPAVEIEKAAERGKEAAQEAAPPAEAPVEPAAPPAAVPAEAPPTEPTPAEGPAPEAPPATPAEAVADAAQHGTEEAQALLSPAFTEHKIRDTTGAVPEPRPAERAEPWKRPEPGETATVTLPGTREPVEATVHGYQGEGPGERVVLELPDGTVRNPLTSGVSFTEHVIRNVTDQAMGLNRAERAEPWVPPAPPVPEPRFTEHQIRDVTGEPPTARPAERAEPWQPPAKPEPAPEQAAPTPAPDAERTNATLPSGRPVSFPRRWPTPEEDRFLGALHTLDRSVHALGALGDKAKPAEIAKAINEAGDKVHAIHGAASGMRPDGAFYGENPFDDALNMASKAKSKAKILDARAAFLKAYDGYLHHLSGNLRDRLGGDFYTGEHPEAAAARGETLAAAAKRIAGMDASFFDKQDAANAWLKVHPETQAPDFYRAIGEVQKAPPVRKILDRQRAAAENRGLKDEAAPEPAAPEAKAPEPAPPETPAAEPPPRDPASILRDIKDGGEVTDADLKTLVKEMGLGNAEGKVLMDYEAQRLRATAQIPVARFNRALKEARAKVKWSGGAVDARALIDALASDKEAGKAKSAVDAKARDTLKAAEAGDARAAELVGEYRRAQSARDRAQKELQAARDVIKEESAAPFDPRLATVKNLGGLSPSKSRESIAQTAYHAAVARVAEAKRKRAEHNPASHSLPDADRPPSLADDAVRPRQEAIDAVLRAWRHLGLPTENLVLAERMTGSGQAMRNSGARTEAIGEIAGTAIGKLAAISLAPPHVDSTTFHEGFHVMEHAGIFTPAEIKVMDRENERLREMLSSGTNDRDVSAMPPKEVRAHVFEAYASARAEGKDVFLPNGAIARAFTRAFEFLRRIRNALRGHGIRTSEDIFRSAYEDRRGTGVSAATPGERQAFKDSMNAGSGDASHSIRDRILRNPIVKRAANTDVARSGAEYTKGMLDDFVMKATPMAVGSDRARAAAKDFANDMRAVQDKYGQIDKMLTEHYTPADRALMGSAIDEQSVMEQTGNVEKGKGLDRLTPDQRATATMLNDLSKKVWQGLHDAGIVTSPDGLPSYMPRMFVSVGEDGSVERLQGDGPGAGAINAIGRNLSTSGPQKRNHLTAAESEAAAKVKFGDNTTLVTDIRALPLALARSERAISGRKLVDAIKKIGDQVGQETTADAEKPGFFTIDHPALKTYSREKVGNEWALTKKPLYISQEFEGPLRAVLTQKSGNLYNALMAFKGGATGLIMYSPLIHNMVEWGRALPLLPGKVITGKVYFEGNRAKNDPTLRAQAVGDGLVPIGRGNHTDITSIAADPQLQPGRSLTAKAIGAGAEAIGLGKDAADGIRRSIDKAGEFWHGTLLWDRVADLQFGIYKNMRDKLTSDGMDAQTAGRVAAHLANRYAGALPAEAASNAARKLANLTFFSRSFTFGNVGVLKDALNGMPLDVRAQISRDAGVLNSAAAQKVAKSAARHAFMLDLGMFYAGNALLQSGMSVLHGDSSLDDEAKGYVSRFVKALGRVSSNPLEALNPFGFLQSLTPNSENEPNKENRIKTPYRNDDGSAIYVRNPVGKVGEEFAGLITNLPEWFKRKESTLLKPVMEILNNDAGFGRKVYDTSNPTVSAYFKAAGNIVGHFMGAQVPLPSIESAASMLTGTAHSADVLKAVGPLVGVGFSKGAPGGPQVGMMFAEQDRARAAIARAMPDVNKLIDGGRTDEAVQKMLDAGMSVSEIRGHLKYRQAPEARINANSMQRFERTATPEEKEKMERSLQRRP